MKESQFKLVMESHGFKNLEDDKFSDSKRKGILYKNLDLGHALVVCRYNNSNSYYIGMVGGSDGNSSEYNNKEFFVDRTVYTAEDVIKKLQDF
jgi:hypothetical protein